MVHIAIPGTKLVIDTCKSAVAFFAAGACLYVVSLAIVRQSSPWIWQSVRVDPPVITRAEVKQGVDIQICKTGTWTSLVTDADTYMDYVAIDPEGHPVNIPFWPAGVHHVQVPPDPGPANNCRPEKLRLDTNLGVGHWGVRLDFNAYLWPGLKIWPWKLRGLDGMVIIAKFEVVP